MGFSRNICGNLGWRNAPGKGVDYSFTHEIRIYGENETKNHIGRELEKGIQRCLTIFTLSG